MTADQRAAWRKIIAKHRAMTIEPWSMSEDEALAAMAEAVAAERERCARIVEKLEGWPAPSMCAAAIRALEK